MKNSAERLWRRERFVSLRSVNISSLRGYSIKECGFGYVVNPNLDSVKNCILLMNLNSDSVNSD